MIKTESNLTCRTCQKSLPKENFAEYEQKSKYPHCKSCIVHLQQGRHETIKKVSYYQKNKEKILDRTKKYQRKNKEKVRASRFKSRLKINHDMGLEEFNNMMTKQNNVCAICEHPGKSVSRLRIDTCKESNVTRGLLCVKCKVTLKRFNDNIGILERTLTYLKAHQS